MLELHVKVHLQNIIDSAKKSNIWTNKMTVIRPGNGKEYVWHRELSIRERYIVCCQLAQWELIPPPEEKDLWADGDIIDIYFQTKWNSRGFYIKDIEN